MPTLKEIWEQNGCKPVKVSRDTLGCTYVEIIAARDNAFIGFSSENSAMAFRSSTITNWTLYQEPRRKKIMYPAILKFSDDDFRMSHRLYGSIDAAKQDYSSPYPKAVALGPPIEIEE